MSNNNKELEVQKQETQLEETERTRETSCFVPKADIYETEETIVVSLDIPGIQQDNINVNLENNILTVNAYANLEAPEGYSLALSEYGIGDYERSFRISTQIDQDNIEAQYKNGVLNLKMPKAEDAKKRQIPIKVS